MEGMDSLTNVRKSWTIDDVMDAHDMLTFRAECEARAYEAARQPR